MTANETCCLCETRAATVDAEWDDEPVRVCAECYEIETGLLALEARATCECCEAAPATYRMPSGYGYKSYLTCDECNPPRGWSQTVFENGAQAEAWEAVR